MSEDGFSTQQSGDTHDSGAAPGPFALNWPIPPSPAAPSEALSSAPSPPLPPPHPAEAAAQPTAGAALDAAVHPGGLGWNIRQAKDAPMHAWQDPLPSSTPLTPAWAAAGAAALPPMPWEREQKPRVGTRAMFGFAFLLRIGLIVALPVIAFVAFGWHSWVTDLFHISHTITQPQTVGPLSLVNNPALAAAESAMVQELQKAGATQTVVAYYGTDNRPQLILIIAKAPHKSQTPAQSFNDYAAGMDTTGLTVNTLSVTDTKSNGTDFLCSPVSGTGFGALSTCMWDDYDVIGGVLDLTGQPVGQTYAQAVEARAAGEH